MNSINHITIVGLGRAGGQLLNAFQSIPELHIDVLTRSTSPDIDGINQVEVIDPNSDLVLLAVQDDSIEEVARTISTEAIIAHCSGSASLNTLIDSGANRAGVFYPVQTFSSGRSVNWESIPICVEGQDEKTTASLLNLAGKITTEAIYLSSEQRMHLHLTAVVVNNFGNHLLTMAEDYLAHMDLPLSLLTPLIRETMDKALALGPDQSQTGPAIRGDQQTISKHFDLLRQHPELLKVYQAMTDSIIEKQKSS